VPRGVKTHRPGTVLALVAGAALVALAAAGVTAGGAATAASGSDAAVAIFYYPWYGTPARDGAWQHWNQRGSRPPALIASGFYPARGPYSSTDPGVVRTQMREIADAGIGTVIVSWWGPGSVEDARLDAVAASARAAGLRVAIHVEPYPGRTPASVAADLHELVARGYTDFYIYDSSFSADAEWAQVNASAGVARVFAHTALPGKAKAGGFEGLYTYDVLVYDGTSFPRVCASARRLGLLCAPSVGPGFDARRATGETRVRSRRSGATYDAMWRSAVKARADAVTITSYNEWHEGTQIEAARAAGPPYASYTGAWGAAAGKAERAYLDRTAYWVQRYLARPAQ